MAAIFPEYVGAVETAGLHTLQLRAPDGVYDGWSAGSGQCWFTTTSVIQDPQKNAALKAFVQGSIEANRRLISDQQFFIDQAAKGAPQIKDLTVAQQKFAWEFLSATFSPNGNFNYGDIQDYLDRYYYKNVAPQVTQKVTARQFADPQFVKGALGVLGTDTKSDWDPPQLT
jgi:hypothetical protein